MTTGEAAEVYRADGAMRNAFEGARRELDELRDKFTALAAVEEINGESCGNASHNIRAVLDGTGDDPREACLKWGLDWRSK